MIIDERKKHLIFTQQEREELSLYVAKRPKITKETAFAEYMFSKLGWTYINENLTMHTGHEYYTAESNGKWFWHFPNAEMCDNIAELINKGFTRFAKHEVIRY